ncbi:MAG TPA: hypothetical protein VE987_07885 [Polyangiaceae bacterium]|nr:hypothetical protein [Polyangiaceae bacterium]
MPNPESVCPSWTTVLYALTNAWIFCATDEASLAIDTVAVLPVGCVTARVTPGMAPVISLVGLVTAIPPTVSCASCACCNVLPAFDSPSE